MKVRRLGTGVTLFDIEPTEARELLALARKVRRLPRGGFAGKADLPFTVALCLGRGMDALRKELERGRHRQHHPENIGPSPPRHRTRARR